MPITTSVKWECDRCDTIHSDETAGRSLSGATQPDRWVQLHECVPPLKMPNDGEQLWLLCPDCRISLSRWFQGDLEPSLVAD